MRTLNRALLIFAFGASAGCTAYNYKSKITEPNNASLIVTNLKKQGYIGPAGEPCYPLAKRVQVCGDMNLYGKIVFTTN